MTHIIKPLSLILIVSLAVLLFLFWLIYAAPRPESAGFDYSILSDLNALLNTLSAVSICIGLFFIKKRDIQRHKRAMITAFAFSALFLVSYITYYTFHGDSRFGGEGIVRYIYFFILISHIFLSIIALPLILLSFYLSLSGKIPIHRRISKITLPIWLYVSVTGVLVYILLNSFG